MLAPRKHVTLVLLAAGRSTRFGAPKQLVPVGPKGETILDLTLRDAFAAGCDDAQIVVRPDHEAHFIAHFRTDPRVLVRVQPQALGTAHAAMIGMEHTTGTTIVANGDDYYGTGSMRVAIAHARTAPPGEHALVAFELGHTLSANGPVNRAVCVVNDGLLAGTEEVTGIQQHADGGINDGQGRSWRPDVPVSMNLWVLRSPLALPPSGQLHGEAGLPDAVHQATSSGHRFRVLHTTDRWCGLTWPGDADLVRELLSQRT